MLERGYTAVLTLMERAIGHARRLYTRKKLNNNPHLNFQICVILGCVLILTFVLSVTYYLDDLDRIEVRMQEAELREPGTRIPDLLLKEYHERLNVINGYDRFTSFPISNKYLAESNTDYQRINLKTFGEVVDKSDGNAEQVLCNDLKFEDNVDVSKQQYIGFDLKIFLEKLHQIEPYSELIKKGQDHFNAVKMDDEEDELEGAEEVIEEDKLDEDKKWLRFGGSSVWLPEYNIHYMVSRVFYSPSGIPNRAFVSFLYIQIFDSDWNELPAGTSLDLPFEDKARTTQPRMHGLFQGWTIEKFLNFKKTSFPQILPIPFDYELEPFSNKYYFGPEDPRVVLRRNPLGFTEPIIVFNMKAMKLTKRVMHIYIPFSNDLKVLKKRNERFAHIEKNWTPLMGLHDISLTKVKFVYSFEPLEVLECDVYSGNCDIIQKPEKDDYDYFGDLRGGTQLIELPLFSTDSLPPVLSSKFQLPQDRKVYIGWARTHLNECGCGDSMYRPNFIALIEDYDVVKDMYAYHISDISGYVDFNVDITPWFPDQANELVSGMSGQCIGRNVLIPNSIAYWEVDSVVVNDRSYSRQDLKDMMELEGERESFLFNDHMGITLSSGDRDVRIVHVKGLLDYVLKFPSLYSEKRSNEDGDPFNVECARRASEEYCRIYAIDHDAAIL
ncbi:Beta-mannosyltransferase 7 [Candida viswanathii]|uniref:Beta-mannosyltransferase 7 n=1 Tax=Candida viswanathii TaxID=5486 RepID=A0A367YJ33_9ASCO|nr:Beta-mannosyltransferase 7 [Candida viswanathii]